MDIIEKMSIKEYSKEKWSKTAKSRMFRQTTLKVASCIYYWGLLWL